MLPGLHTWLALLQVNAMGVQLAPGVHQQPNRGHIKHLRT
jgi:hypothetical protein